MRSHATWQFDSYHRSFKYEQYEDDFTYMNDLYRIIITHSKVENFTIFSVGE